MRPRPWVPIRRPSRPAVRSMFRDSSRSTAPPARCPKASVLLQSIGDFAAMNAVYAEFFTSEMPARMCYQVAALPMGALVEIDAVAVK